MKFRIDIGPERLKKHFSERKSMEKSGKSPTSTPGARHPPATYYGCSHWDFFWRFLKKIARKKKFFFEHETKTKKIDRSFLSIGSSRHVAQFLAHLEHSGYAIVSGEKKSAKIFRYETKFYNGNPYSKLPGAAGIGESI